MITSALVSEIRKELNYGAGTENFDRSLVTSNVIREFGHDFC